IVGDEGFRSLYAGVAGEGDRTGARILVRESSGSLRAGFYCPDSLVRRLERFNPLRGLGDVNVREFGVLVEEIDHLVTLASRSRKPCTCRARTEPEDLALGRGLLVGERGQVLGLREEIERLAQLEVGLGVHFVGLFQAPERRNDSLLDLPLETIGVGLDVGGS